MTTYTIIDQYFTRREIWKKKPHIRLVYERWIQKIKPYLPSGALLEVGSGSGLLRELIPQVILSDVVPLPWNDIAADCLSLPFYNSSIDGVLVFDMLHHAPDPHRFLHEAARVLKPGGRIIFIEPYITWLSHLGYGLMHHEDISFQYYQVPDVDGELSNPWKGNLAVPNLVFQKELPRWNELEPDLNIIHRELFGLFDFQCSGGFKPYAFLPYGLFKKVVKLDDMCRWIMPFTAFRIFVVLEKCLSPNTTDGNK